MGAVALAAVALAAVVVAVAGVALVAAPVAAISSLRRCRASRRRCWGRRASTAPFSERRATRRAKKCRALRPIPVWIHRQRATFRPDSHPVDDRSTAHRRSSAQWLPPPHRRCFMTNRPVPAVRGRPRRRWNRPWGCRWSGSNGRAWRRPAILRSVPRPAAADRGAITSRTRCRPERAEGAAEDRPSAESSSIRPSSNRAATRWPTRRSDPRPFRHRAPNSSPHPPVVSSRIPRMKSCSWPPIPALKKPMPEHFLPSFLGFTSHPLPPIHPIHPIHPVSTR